MVLLDRPIKLTKLQFVFLDINSLYDLPLTQAEKMINGDFVKLKFYEMNQNETIKIDRSQLSYDKLSSVMDTLPKRRSQTVF